MPSPPLPVLYSFRRCPYAIRARLALWGSGTTVVLREVALRHKPSELLALSPKGTVPVMVTPEGEVLEQSLDIMRWALRRCDPQGWLTVAPLEEQCTLVALNELHFKPQLDGHKYPERHPVPAGALPWREQALNGLLGTLELRLQGQTHLMGERAGLADMAVLPFVRQFAQADAPWFAQAPLPAVRRWLQHHLDSALFQAVLPRQKWPVWQPGQPITLFGP